MSKFTARVGVTVMVRIWTKGVELFVLKLLLRPRVRDFLADQPVNITSKVSKPSPPSQCHNRYKIELVLRHTRHKISHLGDVLPSQSLGVVLKPAYKKVSH